MAMKTLRERRDEQAAFVLHTYPYRETRRPNGEAAFRCPVVPHCFVAST